MKAIFALFLFFAASLHSFAADPRPGSPLFRFGAVADCQYCKATSKNRANGARPYLSQNGYELYHIIIIIIIIIITTTSIIMTASSSYE